MASLLIVGICVGTLIGLMALSVVVIFRATGLVNFAHGEVVTVGLFVFLQVVVLWRLNAVFGLIAAAVAAGGLGGAFGVVAPRMARRGGVIVPVIASFGLMVVIDALVVKQWGSQEPYVVPSLAGKDTVYIGNVPVARDYLAAVVVAVTLTAALALFFRATSVGLRMRATVDNPEASELLGVATARLRILAWVIGSALGLGAALPYVSLAFLQTDSMNDLLLKAFAAAAVGGFRSFTAGMMGGIVLGVISSVLSRYTSSDIGDLVAIAAVIGMLFVLPKGLFALGSERS